MSHFSAPTASTPPDAPPDLLTLDEAARAIRVAPVTIRRWANGGRIPSRRLPGPRGRILVPREAVDALLSEGVQR